MSSKSLHNKQFESGVGIFPRGRSFSDGSSGSVQDHGMSGLLKSSDAAGLRLKNRVKHTMLRA